MLRNKMQDIQHSLLNENESVNDDDFQRYYEGGESKGLKIGMLKNAIKSVKDIKTPEGIYDYYKGLKEPSPVENLSLTI